MGIKLRADIFFNDPESRIREYCDIEVYYGFDDQHSVNNTISQKDIDAANQLYAMIDRYDKNESKRLLAKASRISIYLSQIPNQPLHTFNDKEWANLTLKIDSLFKSILSIHGIGIAKATKILHLKRPKLFPILDSLLIQFLSGKIPSSSKADIRLGLSALNKSRQLIQKQLFEFIELQRKISDLPIDLTIVRLFDILCWTTQKWDIQRKTTAPKGRASYSLLKTVNEKVETKQTNAKYSAVSSTETIILEFFDSLVNKAKYGAKGEKPIAVISALKYLKESNQTGLTVLELLQYPHKRGFRSEFIELAVKYGEISSPSGSWSVITGTSQELQIAVKDNGKVNDAFSILNSEEIVKIYNILQKKLSM